MPLCKFFRFGMCRHLNDCKFTHVNCRVGEKCKIEECAFGHVYRNKFNTEKPAQSFSVSEDDGKSLQISTQLTSVTKDDSGIPQETPSKYVENGGSTHQKKNVIEKNERFNHGKVLLKVVPSRLFSEKLRVILHHLHLLKEI